MASLQRVALFIMFDELERDLVNLISSISTDGSDDALSPDERDKAYQRSRGLDISIAQAPIETLLHYLDLGDKFNIVTRLKHKLPDAHAKYLASKRLALENAIPVRNAVMHGRPLTIGEYAQGFALASDLSRSPHYWPSLSRSLRQYNANPEAIRARSIEILDSHDIVETLNNLPMPDYDDTGFLPRAKLEAELRKKILSRHPVVTVLGDGGNGKTALTLQTLYGLLSDESHGFDGIVWVSAKSSTLTTNEIKRIENAITTSAGVFSKVAETFESEASDPLKSVKSLLESNKILLVIDNLETVLDKSIRDFISDIPGESKVLFTSRIPIGSDITVSVDGFTEKESLTFLRRVIEAYSVSSLKAAPDNVLLPYLKRLGGKPLLIKWFALSVLAGADPNAVVRNPETALRFCLENVFDSLDAHARKVLSIMAQLPRAVSLEVLRFVSDANVMDLERGIASLLMYTILQSKEVSTETVYELKPFARAYVSRVMNLRHDDVETLLSRFRSLEGVMQEETGASSNNRYDPRVYTVRNVSEALCVKNLRQAVYFALKGSFEAAKSIIEGAKVSNPSYFEVYRVEAFIHFEEKDYISASECYGRAIDIAHQVPQLRMFYAWFLVKAYNDYKSAAVEIEAALTEDESSPKLKLELARIKMFQMDFRGSLEVLNSICLPADRIEKMHTVVKDVEFNVHKRNLEYLSARGEGELIKSALLDWALFHENLDPRLIDDKMIESIKIMLTKIKGMYSRYSEIDAHRLFSAMNEIISYMEPKAEISSSQSNISNPLRGKMKLQGLKPAYGFLNVEGGGEIFIHQSACEPDCWDKLKAGRSCVFTTAMDPSGRVRVASAKLE